MASATVGTVMKQLGGRSSYKSGSFRAGIAQVISARLFLLWLVFHLFLYLSDSTMLIALEKDRLRNVK